MNHIIMKPALPIQYLQHIKSRHPELTLVDMLNKILHYRSGWHQKFALKVHGFLSRCEAKKGFIRASAVKNIFYGFRPTPTLNSRSAK